jgi:hypothetical protein
VLASPKAWWRRVADLCQRAERGRPPPFAGPTGESGDPTRYPVIPKAGAAERVGGTERGWQDAILHLGQWPEEMTQRK